MRKYPLLTLLPIILFTILLIVLTGALLRSHEDAGKFADHIGDAVPLTSLGSLPGDGKISQLSFNTKAWLGRPYMVNFFASWCIPCRAEHDSLMQLAAAKIAIVGIAYKDKPETVRAFLTKNGNPFTLIAADNKGHTAIDWGMTGVPETFIIDKDGFIRFHQTGPLTEAIVTQHILPLWRSLAP
jgi:DsbE subfamily thiol:disulfide oxidoreductase